MSSNAPPPQGPPATPPEGPPTPGPSSEAAPEAPDPTKRACPACGAANALTSSFCWQCLTSLGGRPGASPAGGGGGGGYATAGPAAGQAGGGYTPPERAQGPLGRPGSSTFGGNTYENRQPVTNELDSVVPLPASKPANPLVSALKLLVVGAAIVGGFWFGWNLFNRGGIEIPDSIAGIPLREDPSSLQAVDLLEEAFSGLGYEVEVGLYGDAGNPSPSAMMMVWRDTEALDADTAFQQFATGFAQSGGGTIDPGDIQRRDFEGVSYVCAPTDAALQAVCMWIGEGGVGIVGGYDRDLLGTFQMTVSAHDQIAG